MPAYTNNLGLIKPEPGEYVDINQINSNFDVLDSTPGTRIVTSTSRPSTPFVGMEIYETDTKQKRIWTGDYWTGIHYGTVRQGEGAPTLAVVDGEVWVDTDAGLMYFSGELIRDAGGANATFSGNSWKEALKISLPAGWRSKGAKRGSLVTSSAILETTGDAYPFMNYSVSSTAMSIRPYNRGTVVWSDGVTAPLNQISPVPVVRV